MSGASIGRAADDGIAAIILAGGRATRLGGVDKPAITVGGVSLLEHVAAAASAGGCAPIVVVAGERHARPGVRLVLESPPHGGPVAALDAALPFVTTPSVLVLAADLPNAGILVPALVSAAIPDHADGTCAVDAGGRRQWLAGRYRTAALARAIAALRDGPRDESMRALLADLVVIPIPTPPGAADDLDRWQDVARARRLANAGGKDAVMSTGSSRTLPPEALDEWAAALRVELRLTAEQLPTAAILDLAREVANGVARPAAPLSAFAAGLAAGLRGGEAPAIAETLATITALATEWAPDATAPERS
jgi:molybdopterin-guanine dinucleotide biosynthesis protein A